jgi:uncharacterized repeat protein (TIGR02543 family)
MFGGEISGNTASSSSSRGGGVCANGTFTMSGGEISGNTASSYAYAYGGGVCADGTFTMSGGEISGNTASSYAHAYGGGVYISSSGVFTKQSGGIIYGSDASDTLRNTVTSGNRYGHAVYSDGKKRNTTAGSGVTLDSSISGAAGGWEYTVTFDADGGSSAAQTLSVASDGTVGVSNMPSAPTKDGYAFGGWYTSTGGGGTQFTASTQVTGDITVYATWNPGVPVQITLQPQPGDPPLSNTSIFVDQSAQFSVDETGYASWQWYWQGRPISGANSSGYTLTANSNPAGIYEVAVVVTTNEGAKLSARCRVTIKAR